MLDERHQFRILVRSFFSRAIDLELLSPGGEIDKLMTQFAAILAAFNFVVAYVLVPRYFISTRPHSILVVSAWSDEEFLISTTISVVGLFIVLAWENLVPDARDSFALGVLPVRTRTIALAKVTSVGGAVGAIVLLVNVFTSLCYAGIAASDSSILAVLRTLAAYWLTMGMAALFTLAAFIGIQGIAAQALSYRAFQRWSGMAQLLAFFSILAVYFLKPQLATVAGLAAPQNRGWLTWLPSYWFLGIFQELNGSASPSLARLARHGWYMTGLATSVAAFSLCLVYGRTVKKIVEQPDIAPTDRSRRSSGALSRLVELMCNQPIDRALVLFALRTFIRSRKHRLLLAMFSGIGLAIAAAYTESLWYGIWDQRWNQANAPLMVATLVLLFFVVFGMRIVFTFPYALRSNWIFRVTAVQRPARYFFAVRKSLYTLAAFPIVTASVVFLLAIWPVRPVLLHILVLVTVAVILVEKSLYGFRKIPFACSYLPGKANLKVTLGCYTAVILFAAHQGGFLEFWAMQRPTRYVVLLAILLIWAMRARYRLCEFASAPLTPIQFEDRSPTEILTIDLRQDGELLGGEMYVEPDQRRSLLPRLLKQGWNLNRNRLASLLPLCAILVTAALWYRAHLEFSSSSLDVPIALQLAGMLNGPVAVLASPYYSLSHGDVRTWRLAILLLAVAFQWAYIGYLIDSRHKAPSRQSPRGYGAGAVGVLFAFGPLIPAFSTHVGLMYKAAALAWSLLMVYHFMGFLRNARGAA